MAKDIRVALTLDDRDFKRKLNQSKKAVSDLEGTTASTSAGLGKLAGAFAAVAAAALAVKAAATKLITVQRQFDIINASLVTVTGSAQNAAAAFDQIKDFASTTPFALAEVANAFVKLKAFGLDPSERALLSYGNTASAMGKSLDQMIEAVADAATMEFERLKEFGIKTKQEGDKVKFTFQGVTTTVGKNAAEIEAFLLGLGEVEFAGAMSERANTLDGAISNLSDSWNILFLTVSQSGIGDFFKETAKDAAGLADALTDLLNLKAIDDMQKQLIALQKLRARTSIAIFDPATADANAALVAELDSQILTLVASLGLLTEEAEENRVLVLETQIDDATSKITDVAEELERVRARAAEPLTIFDNVAGTVPFTQEIKDIRIANLENQLKDLISLTTEARQALNDIPQRAPIPTTGPNQPDAPFVGPANPSRAAREEFREAAREADRIAAEAQRAAQAILDLQNDNLQTIATTVATSKAGLENKVAEMELERSLVGMSTIQKENAREIRDLENERAEAVAEISSLQLDSNAFVNLMMQGAAIMDINGLYKDQIALILALQEGNREAATDFAGGWSTALKDFSDGVEDKAAQAKQLFDTVTNGFSNAFVEFTKTGKLSFKGMLDDIMKQLVKAQANKLFAKLLGSATGGAFGGVGSFIAKLFDKGGNIPGGQFGIVGERGPELVQGPASVTSRKDTAAMLGGSTAVTYNINAVDARSFKQLVASDPEFIYNVTQKGAQRI